MTVYAAIASGQFVRNSVIDPSEIAATGMNGRFSGCGAADGFGELHCCVCEHQSQNTSALGSQPPFAAPSTKVGRGPEAAV
jgi:hypothetical protein